MKLRQGMGQNAAGVTGGVPVADTVLATVTDDGNVEFVAERFESAFRVTTYDSIEFTARRGTRGESRDKAHIARRSASTYACRIAFLRSGFWSFGAFAMTSCTMSMSMSTASAASGSSG